jgi:LacI family transcriptional regulator
MDRVTLADVAKACGVSAYTVSRAMNDKSDISRETRERILKAADEMGYTVNASARFLRTGRSKSIGIIIGDIANPSFSISIRMIDTMLRKHGYNCMVFDSEEDEQIEKRSILDAIGKNVDGIIICPAQKSDANIRFMQEQNIPFVLMSRRFEHLNTNYVICDDYEGGRQAAQYLVDKGCKRIAYLTLEPYVSNTRERFDGITQVLRENQIGLSEKDCYYVQGGQVSHKEIVMKLLSKDYDAVICFCDAVSLELMCYAQRELTIISFDNIKSHFFLPCKFASLGADKEKFVSALVECLLDAIEGKGKPQGVILDTQIYE